MSDTLTWGRAFDWAGVDRRGDPLPMPRCPAGDGLVQVGHSARGDSQGRVWHDDCAESAWTDDHCPADPDGLHHVGCGCPDSDYLD